MARRKATKKKASPTGKKRGRKANPFKVEVLDNYKIGRVKRSHSKEVEYLIKAMEKLPIGGGRGLGIPIMHTTADKNTARSWATSAVRVMRKKHNGKVAYAISTLKDDANTYVGTAILRTA
jgi:hypothetical protein